MRTRSGLVALLTLGLTGMDDKRTAGKVNRRMDQGFVQRNRRITEA